MEKWQNEYDKDMFMGPQDTEDGPRHGSCWNCGHAVDTVILGISVTLCCKERDTTASGDVIIVDDGVTDCEDWVDYERVD